jgi:ribosomal protein S11
MKRLFPLMLALALVATTGCHIFSKKKNPSAPTGSKTAAADVEKDFMHRWIDKRTTELVAQGSSPEAAQLQATTEFKVRFNYTDAARNAK